MKRRFRRWSGSVRQIAREPSFDRARVKGWSCERASRLACLRRTCRRANTRGAVALGSNPVRQRAGCGFVRFGRDGHRTQFGAVSLGEWAKGPGPGEAQCPAGRAARSACLRRSPGEDSTQSRFAQRDSCVSGMRLCRRPRPLGFRLSQSLAQGRRLPCVATQSQHLRPRRHVAASGLSVGLRSDQTIRLCAAKASTAQAEELRRVSEVDSETKQKRVFLTNPFDLAALIMPRSIGAAGASHFSSARPRSTCASAKFSVTRRTQYGSKSERQRPPAFPLPSRSSKRIKRRLGINGRKSKSRKIHFPSYL
jgi:hypothetical protein